jgi:hypothetical protein
MSPEYCKEYNKLLAAALTGCIANATTEDTAQDVALAASIIAEATMSYIKRPTDGGLTNEIITSDGY